MSFEPNRRIFVAKISKSAVYLTDLIVFAIFSISTFALYKDFQNSDLEFFVWFQKNILLNWFFWLGFTTLFLVLLNSHFRSIEFGEKLITVKRWYGKTQTFNYFDIKEIIFCGDSVENNEEKIQINLKNHQRVKVPAYLFDSLTEFGGTNEDLVKFIQEKTDYSVLVKR